MLSDAPACPSKAHLPPEIFQLSVLLKFNWPLTRYEECLPSEGRAKSFHRGTIKVTLLKSPAQLWLLASPRVRAFSGLLFARVCEKDLINQAEHAAR